MSFDQNTISLVWLKGKTDARYDPAMWRLDDCGYFMKFIDYGNRDSGFGWEIDHIIPGGGDNLNNLRPLNWRPNVKRN